MKYIERARFHLKDFLGTVEQVVNMESPSREPDAVNRLGAYLKERFETLGGRVETVPGAPYGDHLFIEYGQGDKEPVLVLCHMDTVFPLGNCPPFAREDDRLKGGGVLDMKGGIVLLIYALLMSQDLGLDTGPLRIIINSDEEIGSPTSRQLIEEHARRCRHVLVLEPGMGPEGKIKVARKGVAIFGLRITGRAAHAGSDPTAGVSAVHELAHQILALHALNDTTTGTTVNVAPVSGGSASNIVAEQAQAEIDVRIEKACYVEPVLQAIRSLQPVLPGAGIELEGGLNRPPMECSAAMALLAQKTQKFAGELGFSLDTGMTGGGSDGNFTAAIGTPTLDGLGVAGAGAHSQREYVRLASVPERLALLVRLLCEL